MPFPTNIAIDGPAGSGKTTLGRKLATHLGYVFFDTGVMYRAVTWAALNAQVDLDDQAQVTQIAETADIAVHKPSVDDGRDNDLIVNGVDITWDIRTPAVDANVSKVAAYPGVRTALTKQQRKIGTRGPIVMVGRDIGTVVLPDADFKLYLDASVEERARRRHMERLARDGESSYDETLASMQKRDQIDSTREVAPLKPADDARYLSCDDLNADEVLDRSIILIESLRSPQSE
jgi:cytidylate kinase